MLPAIVQPGLQASTLRLYGELLCRRDRWARNLVFAAFDGACATGLSAASSLAGAVSLVADSDSANMKAHFRDGAFDFLVNTLDEALRAIKNEIRQGKPIAIGLMAQPEVVLSEAAERGVAADLLLAGASEAKPVLAADGIRVEAEASSAELVAWLARRHWSEYDVPWLRAVSQTSQPVAAILPAEDQARRTWLRDLTAHQRSARGSNGLAVWLTAQEAAQVEGAVSRR